MAKRKAKPAKAGEDSPSPADYQALSDFRYALRRFLAFSSDAAREVGLTPQQHQALLAIMGHPAAVAMTIGMLAERLLLKHHSTVELVDRLDRFAGDARLAPAQMAAFRRGRTAGRARG